MSLNLLILDTETTGVDPQQDKVIEVGAILYSVKYQTTISQLSFLIPADDNPAAHINRIPSSVLKDCPASMQTMQGQYFAMLHAMAAEATYVVAHNAAFDCQWFLASPLPTLKRADGKSLPWLCTMSGMTWPQQARPGESLVNLALNHGIGIGSAHRALTDCQLIAELFNRVTQEQLLSLVAQAARPQAFFKACVSIEERDLAKQAGFRWHPEAKLWGRLMAMEDAQKLPFQTVELNAITLAERIVLHFSRAN